MNIAHSVYCLGSKVDFCRHSCLWHVDWLVLNTVKDSCSFGRNIYKPQLHELHHANIVNYLYLLNYKNRFLILRYLSSLNPPKVGGYCWLIVLYHCYAEWIAHSLKCVCDIRNILAFGCISAVRWMGVLILIRVLFYITRPFGQPL